MLDTAYSQGVISHLFVLAYPHFIADLLIKEIQWPFSRSWEGVLMEDTFLCFSAIENALALGV